MALLAGKNGVFVAILALSTDKNDVFFAIFVFVWLANKNDFL